MFSAVKPRDSVCGFNCNRSRKSLCKHRLFRPVWVSLLSLVAIFTLVNLLVGLHSIADLVTLKGGGASIGSFAIMKKRALASIDNLTPSTPLNDTRWSLTDRLTTPGRFDATRNYVIHDFVYQGLNWPIGAAEEKPRVTLATQTLVDRLHRLVEVAHSWNGLMSVAVYVPGEEFHVALLYVDLLTSCFPAIANNVSIHFVYPAERRPMSVHGANGWRGSCYKEPASLMHDLLARRTQSFRSWRKNDVLPPNLLYNVARKASHTKYVYLTDIDVVPRSGLADDLNDFLRRTFCYTCAYVIPTYNVHEYTYRLPANKTQLLNMIREKHPPISTIPSQEFTNYSQWESITQHPEMGFAYPILPEFDANYDPYYVAADTVPQHDERFLSERYARSSQVYHMQFTSQQFFVLNNAFALRRGLVRKSQRNSQQDAWNAVKYNSYDAFVFTEFKNELSARYEKSSQFLTVRKTTMQTTTATTALEDVTTTQRGEETDVNNG